MHTRSLLHQGLQARTRESSQDSSPAGGLLLTGAGLRAQEGSPRPPGIAPSLPLTHPPRWWRQRVTRARGLSREVGGAGQTRTPLLSSSGPRTFGHQGLDSRKAVLP